jgi:putative transposase
MVNELDEPFHHRKSIRLSGYDYSDPGVYFLTITTYQRLEIFGKFTDSGLKLNSLGEIAHEEWLITPNIRHEITLDEFVIMPDHMHAILFINEIVNFQSNGDISFYVGAHGRAPLQDPDQMPLQEQQNSRLYRPPRSLGSLVAGYKSKVTSRINALRSTPGEPVWQRNYYEHIVRSEKELDDIRLYIQGNPETWGKSN